MILKILKLNVFFLFTLISFLSANEIKDISVKGNQRISKETIIVLGNYNKAEGKIKFGLVSR